VPTHEERYELVLTALLAAITATRARATLALPAASSFRASAFRVAPPIFSSGLELGAPAGARSGGGTLSCPPAAGARSDHRPQGAGLK
jgi:hypothetical protein